MSFDRGAISALLRRPSLVIEALSAWLALRRRGGLTPPAAYMRWRTVTAYGDPLTAIRGEDLVDYLHWRRAMRRIG